MEELPDSPPGHEASPFRGFLRAANLVQEKSENSPARLRAEASSTATILDRGRHGAQLSGMNREPRRLSERVQPEIYENKATSTTSLEHCLLFNNEEKADPTPVLGYRYPTQWRPEIHTKETDQHIVSILDETLKNLANAIRPTQPRYRSMTPRFDGAEWEDPNDFLRNIERYSLQEGYHQEEWVLVAVDQLQGEASRWYEAYRSLNLGYDEFRQLLLERYDSVAMRSRLQAKLYGQKQGREDSTMFIMQKMALYRRLSINISENLIVQQIREMLTPDVRMALRGAVIQNINQLVQLASAVETDLKEINRRTTSSSTAMTSTNNTGRTIGNQIIRQAAQSRSSNSSIPPYPCRYCQENHYHSDCPRRRPIEPPLAQNTVGDFSGNPSRGTSGNSSRAALPEATTSRPHFQ